MDATSREEMNRVRLWMTLNLSAMQADSHTYICGYVGPCNLIIGKSMKYLNLLKPPKNYRI